MIPNAEKRFQEVQKLKGRRKLKKIHDDFMLASDEAQELCLQVNANRLFSCSPCSIKEFEELVTLGYKSRTDIGDAIVPEHVILEYKIYHDAIPYLKRYLRPTGEVYCQDAVAALQHADIATIQKCLSSENCMEELTALGLEYKKSRLAEKVAA